MNLLCPNCQKMLQVSEQYAGQLMKCPLCEGQFTVPGLPGAAAAPLPTAAPARSEAAHPPAPVPPPQTEAPAPPPPPPGEHGHRRSWQVNPRVVPWVAPAAFLVLFALLFFPWVGMYPAGLWACDQSAWGAAFGWLGDCDPIWEGLTGLEGERAQPEASTWLLLYVLLLLLVCLPLGLGSMGLTAWRQQQPSFLAAAAPYVPIVRPWRAVVVLAAAAVTFGLLLLQFAVGFGLHDVALAEADRQAQEARPKTAAAKKETRGEGRTAELSRARLVAGFGVRTTWWARLALLVHLAALVGAALDFWLERRGSRPVPRLDVLW
jgi:hypothetical protein